MLPAMEQSLAAPSTPALPGFAGLLASLASPAEEAGSPESSWSNSQLRDDVVTLSYEQALRHHARYRPKNLIDSRLADELRDDAGAGQLSPDVQALRDAPSPADAAPHATPSRDLRTTSVTIRLSSAECLQLRQRAAEAGLTVSAYLRSCVLEADTLRAQVKAALAEMRSIETKGATEEVSKQSRRHNRFGWIARALPRRQHPVPAPQS